MSQPRTRRKKGQYAITDPDQLAVLLRGTIEKRFGGNESAAAGSLAGSLRERGSLQKKLNRLIRGEIGAVSNRTAQQLVELMGESGKDRLRETLLSPEARIRLAIHERWTRRMLRHTPGTDRQEALLRREHPHLFEKFDGFLEKYGYVEVIRAPNGQVRARRRSQRAELAFREVLAPLRRDVFTAKIELGLEELSEVERYLKHALGAQQVLLTRPSDLERAQSVPKKPARPGGLSVPFAGAPPGTFGPGVLGMEAYQSEAPARQTRAESISPE